MSTPREEIALLFFVPGLSQAEIARRVGCSQGYVSHVVGDLQWSTSDTGRAIDALRKEVLEREQRRAAHERLRSRLWSLESKMQIAMIVAGHRGGWCFAEIARRVGCSVSTVKKYVRIWETTTEAGRARKAHEDAVNAAYWEQKQWLLEARNRLGAVRSWLRNQDRPA